MDQHHLPEHVLQLCYSSAYTHTHTAPNTLVERSHHHVSCLCVHVWCPVATMLRALMMFSCNFKFATCKHLGRRVMEWEGREKSEPTTTDGTGVQAAIGNAVTPGSVCVGWCERLVLPISLGQRDRIIPPRKQTNL